MIPAVVCRGRDKTDGQPRSWKLDFLGPSMTTHSLTRTAPGHFLSSLRAGSSPLPILHAANPSQLSLFNSSTDPTGADPFVVCLDSIHCFAR